jgi:uncharacterized protein YehS (DUF1456 family)
MMRRLRIAPLAANLDWITALKAPQVQKLAAAEVLPLSLFEQQNLAEITTDDYPGERLVICRNPLVADERGRKREALLVATEAQSKHIAVDIKDAQFAFSRKTEQIVREAELDGIYISAQESLRMMRVLQTTSFVRTNNFRV